MKNQNPTEKQLIYSIRKNLNSVQLYEEKITWYQMRIENVRQKKQGVDEKLKYNLEKYKQLTGKDFYRSEVK